MPADPVPFGEPAPAFRRYRSAPRIVLLLIAAAGIAYFQAAERIYGRAGAESDRTARFHSRGRDGQSPGAFNTPSSGARLSPSDVQRYPDAPLYGTDTLRTVFLEFPSAAWEQELAARYHGDAELPATVTVDGETYRDVGVRFRGNSSYRMVPAGLKRSLNLSFDAVHADQQLHGYRTLNFLNATSDPTFVRAVLYSEIARKYLPTPKVNFVRVVINGESWGIYLNAQQFNKDFLRDFYGTTGGTRWKVPGTPRGRSGLEYLGEGTGSYKTLYELKSKDTEKAWTDLVRLCRLLNATAREDLEALLAPHLDVDGVLKFLALEVALVNTDGYWTRASDYSIFQNEAGRFHILPYDFNEGLGVRAGGGRRAASGSGIALDPLVGLDDASKPLRSRLLAVPALRQRYLAYVGDIAENWMDWARLAPLVERYQRLIEADVKTDGRKLYGFEGFEPDALRRFLDERRAFLLDTLKGKS